MTGRDLNRLALALGVRSGDDFSIDELVERATFYRQFAQWAYRSCRADAVDFEAACSGVAPATVGCILVELNREASREADTLPAPPPTSTLPPAVTRP